MLSTIPTVDDLEQWIPVMISDEQRRMNEWNVSWIFIQPNHSSLGWESSDPGMFEYRKEVLVFMWGEWIVQPRNPPAGGWGVEYQKNPWCNKQSIST